MDFRKVGVWAATIFIGAMFVMQGANKLFQSAEWTERFTVVRVVNWEHR